MPKSIKGTEPVIDPLQSAPKLSGEIGAEEPARARVRRRRGQQDEVVLAPLRCPNAHDITESMKFCPQCGVQIPEQQGPLHCRNGHEVTADSKFCATCGVPLAAETTFSENQDFRPRPDAELSDAERAERARMHEQAVRLGKENPVIAYAPGRAPANAQSVVIHFLVDGITAFGNVWMRGQEIELWPGHARWKEAENWIHLDTAGQYARFGRQIFGNGPWPGVKTYTAAAGRFQPLKALSGSGDVPQPTEADLAAADEAERKRGRRVPMPLG